MRFTLLSMAFFLLLCCSATVVVAQSSEDYADLPTLESWTKSLCDCAYGTVGSGAGEYPFFCDCQCNDGFMRPSCLDKAKDYSYVQLLVNETVPDGFNGGRLEREVKVGLGVSATYEDIWLRVRETNTTAWSSLNPGLIVVQFTLINLEGISYADKLIEDVRTKKAWTTTGLTGAEIVHARPLPIDGSGARRAFETKVYESDIVTVYLDDIAWLLGVVGCFVVLCCLECLFFSSTKKKAQEMLDAEIYERDAKSHLAAVPVGSAGEVNPFIVPQPGYVGEASPEKSASPYPAEEQRITPQQTSPAEGHIKEEPPGVPDEAVFNQGTNVNDGDAGVDESKNIYNGDAGETGEELNDPPPAADAAPQHEEAPQEAADATSGQQQQENQEEEFNVAEE